MPLENIRKNSLIHKEFLHKINDKKPTDTSSQEVPSSTLLSASMTVEAALVFPFFLFTLIGILFFFRVLQVTQITAGALAAAGSQMSLEAGEEESMVKAMGYFYKELLEEDCPFSYVLGGKAGFGWIGTELDGEYVDLKLQYQCKLPVRLFGMGNIPITQHMRVKKWTGYRKGADSGLEESWVYITPTGTVYHMTGECTHLRLSIRTMGKQEAAGSGYEPCLLCGSDAELYSYYYVTEDGEKYHTRLSCSGLKRTVYIVKRSEVGTRAACSRCGSEW